MLRTTMTSAARGPDTPHEVQVVLPARSIFRADPRRRRTRDRDQSRPRDPGRADLVARRDLPGAGAGAGDPPRRAARSVAEQCHGRRLLRRPRPRDRHPRRDPGAARVADALARRRPAGDRQPPGALERRPGPRPPVPRARQPWQRADARARTRRRSCSASRARSSDSCSAPSPSSSSRCSRRSSCPGSTRGGLSLLAARDGRARRGADRRRQPRRRALCRLEPRDLA